MATYRERGDDEEITAEDLEDALGELPGSSRGWTVEHARLVGPVEDDGDGGVLIDEDQCYHHVGCTDPTCFRDEIVLAAEVGEYREELRFLRLDLVKLHTNLRLLATLAAFPWRFYAPDGDSYYEWMAGDLYEYSIVKTWRLWSDDDPRAVTLKKLGQRVVRTAEPRFADTLRGRIRERKPKGSVGATLTQIGALRNKQLGHSDRDAILRNGTAAIWPSLADLQAVAHAFAHYLDALMFKDAQHWVVESVVHQLEWHLDVLALESDWSKVFDQDPDTWRTIIRPKINQIDVPPVEVRGWMRDVDRRRASRQLPPLPW